MTDANADNPNSPPWTTVLLALAGVFVARVLFILVFPHNLDGEEAQYWDWGRQPAFGYFSKPPLIAWMAVAGEFAGNVTWAIRVWAALFGTITLGLGYALARRMFDARTAFWFALALAPFAVVQNLVLTTDAPLLLFWTASLLALWCWVDADSAGERGRALGVLTVTLGLGYLSKQTMFAFPAFAFLFLVTDRELRGRLLTPAE